MGECKECVHYEDVGTYKSAGICNLHDMYVKEDETCCNDFEEAESHGY